MAAYAALVSLMRTIEQIQNHPHPPISLDKKQVESLSERITFLQDFLECYNFRSANEEADGLQRRIADAAYVTEDIIETHVVDQILAQSTSTTHGEKMITSIDFYQSLQKVIEDMDFIKKEVIEIRENMGSVQDQLHRNSLPDVSLRSPSMGQNTMVGFDDVLTQLMDKLTGQQSSRQIIPIVGMGGIGKTTVARNVYEKSLIVQHFDRRAWVTISQEYSVREILLVLLCQISQEKRETLSKKSEQDLGLKLHQTLLGRRYLITMDDIWSIEAWDKVKFFFPDNNNGSRILLTTRLSNVALDLSRTNSYEMRFLDEDKSWYLLCKNVFVEESCPLELEEVGKEIAKSCKGLPLSIVVIGGLLAKSKQTRENWEYILDNLNSIVILEDNERCLKILYTSYNHLPVHLKPCFLYMRVFPENSEIRVTELIKLWDAEGFLKPINGKSSNEVAQEYLKDLTDRNLILVSKWGFSGKMKLCNIHDLLRDLCLREAEKDEFLCVRTPHSLNIPQGMSTQRRIAIHQSTPKEECHPQVVDALKSASSVRSLICNLGGVLPSPNFRLLRVLKAADESHKNSKERHSLQAIFQLVNSRCLILKADWSLESKFPSSSCLLWNLTTLIVKGSLQDSVAPSQIWKMTQLRHVKFDRLDLPDPINRRDDIVLGNLQTLLRVANFKCGEEVVRRIPNVKKLKIFYKKFEDGSVYCLINLARLNKLESLDCSFSDHKESRAIRPSRNDLLQNLTFPHSLKKLALGGSYLQREDLTTKIGSLPLLEVLRLGRKSFLGPKWETVERQFPRLKVLHIYYGEDLEYWITDSTHFPRLEYLHIGFAPKLKEIPSCIGDIPSLQLIELIICSSSAVISAKKIVEEQEELGNEDIQVRVVQLAKDKELESLASHNFQIQSVDGTLSCPPL